MPFRNRPALALDGGALDGLGSLFSLIWMLVCVLAIVVLAYFFTRYVAGRGGAIGVSGGSERFKVLARLPLGREQSAVLVKAGETYLLLGVTASEVTVLKELTSEEAEAVYALPPDQPAPPSFGEALRAVLKQKKPR